MYPQPELIRLTAHKTTLRRTISVRRAESVSAAVQATRPLAWLDRFVALWRKISPVKKIVAIPLAIIVGRTLRMRVKALSTLLRWLRL